VHSARSLGEHDVARSLEKPMTIDEPSGAQVAPRGYTPAGKSISLRNGTAPSGSTIQM
jgi:hypothetical protein